MKTARPKRVLFICIGNSCRSQMAEGFAHAFGGNVMVAESAGLTPAFSVARETVRTMAERNVDISTHFPKRFEPARSGEYDLLINMSGFDLPGGVTTPERLWDVPDPIGESPEVYRLVCDQIEGLVMDLIREFRSTGGSRMTQLGPS